MFQIIPIAWVLMENKTYEGYSAVFRLLKHLCPNLNPETIISDWESGQQRAWQEAFPSKCHKLTPQLFSALCKNHALNASHLSIQ